jgi:hypothetical protein
MSINKVELFEIEILEELSGYRESAIQKRKSGRIDLIDSAPKPLKKRPFVGEEKEIQAKKVVTYDDEKPWRCHCQFKFYTEELLKNHILEYHTLVHQCQICSQNFKGLAGLRCHLSNKNKSCYQETKVLNGSFLCDRYRYQKSCNRKFLTEKDLQEHIFRWHDKE